MSQPEAKEKHTVNYGPRQTQYANVKRLERMGFSNEGDTSTGIALMKINEDGFVEKMVVDITGKVRRYKPWKPNLRETQRLPRDTSRIASHHINY